MDQMHYENMPMQYTEISKVVKTNFPQKIYYGYTLEPRGHTIYVLEQIKKNMYTPSNPMFSI